MNHVLFQEFHEKGQFPPRFSPNSLSELCHVLTTELVKRDAAIRGISILVTTRIRDFDELIEVEILLNR